MWGPVYLRRIVLAYNRSSPNHSLSPSLTSFSNDISPKHSTPGWLTSETKSLAKSVCLSVSLFPLFSRSSHVKAYMHSGKKKRPGPFIDDVFAREQVWGRHCGVVLEDLCEYIQVDSMKYATVLPLINASNIGEHLITVFKKKSENLLPRNLQEILCVVCSKQLQRP